MISAEDVVGAVFWWDPLGSGNLHRWIILSEPDSRGACVVVSLTDAFNYPVNPQVWPKGTSAGGGDRLSKDSVIRIDLVRIDRHTTIQSDGAFSGHIGLDLVLLARHHVCQMRKLLRPKARTYLDGVLPAWCEECPWADRA